MNNTYIVTVRLPRNPDHNPHNKVTGVCPINPNAFCTDVTGEHHSFLLRTYSLSAAWREANLRFDHVTRIEELDE